MARPQQHIAISGRQVPAERISAHGFVPVTLIPNVTLQRPPTAGICSVAQGWAEALLAEDAPFVAAVLTTRCDQLRRTAEALQERTRVPVFLMNIPATHGTEVAQRLYREELRRLDGFLSRLGGTSLVGPAVTRASTDNLPVCHGLSAPATRDEGGLPLQTVSQGEQAGFRVGLLGCSLTEADYAVLRVLRQVGLQVVVNATESPMGDAPTALGTAQESVPQPSIGQRPNAPFFERLQQMSCDFGLDGWVLLRQPWCDLFHAEVVRLKSAVERPWLELETGACPALASLRTRAEAFAEMLQACRSAEGERR